MEINAGDTAWVLMSAALVMLMTPALGFFYAGLVGKRNALSTLTHSFFILCLVSVQFVLVGYSLAFGPDVAGLIGNLDWAALNGVGIVPNTDYAPGVPHEAYMVFQLMFAVITPALITGAIAERITFKAFVVFTLLWSTLVYAPIAHWVWGTGGWLHTLGALDFAGGTVVHVSSGVSALVAALVVGRRLVKTEPHDVTMTILGAGLLWFGWFGFNAGSALSAGGLAANAFVVTNTAAAMGGLTWLTVSWIHRGQPSALGAALGAVAGLVAITPASGYVTPSAAIVIGLGAGVFCYLAVLLRPRLRVDDALDVWAVHGIGGTWGAIATGLFATVAVNSAAADGLFAGNPEQLLKQAIAVGATWLYAGVATAVIVKAIQLTIGLRVHERDEVLGLDRSQHGEIAYQLD
ncbi:MAG: ammonium transporter [Candidatus Limnocylindrales bacterium]